MIDERNINNIIELIESSNQKIKNIKEVIEEQKSTFELPENDFKNLANVVEEVLRSRNFDNLGELFGNIDKNISFKTEFLKEQYSTLDENILKVQNISKHIDKDISDDVSSLVDIVETFSYKIKILQGIIGDVNNKITTFNGDKPEVFLKDFRSDCRDFDEEFDQVLRELKANFRRASEITNKLAKFDTGVDLAKELFSINISINAIMSAISVFDEKYRDLGKAFEESGLYAEFSGKIEDLSYNTKHLIRNIDSFNKIIEDGSSIKEQVGALEQKIEGINGVIQQLNQEGFLEFKALLSSIDNSDDLAQIKEHLASLGQEEKFEELRSFIQGNLALINNEEKLDEIKNIILNLNQGEQLEELKTILSQTLEGSDYIQELKSVASNLSHAKIFGQFEHILNEIKSNDKISLEKTDELLRIVSVVNFGEVEKEISFLTNDLEIILEEIKHSRSISDKSFSKIETIFDNFNLNDLKNRIYDFENYLKKFLQKDDLQVFSNEISAVVEKFELANGVIIDGFDDLDALRTQILSFDEKFIELTDNVKNIMDQHQEKFDSTIEAFDNGYKIDELNHLSNDILANLSESKEAVVQSLNDSQEKLSFLIKTIDNSDKLEEIQNESAEKLFALSESSQAVSEDLTAIKASLFDIVRSNQEKFEETINVLEKKADAREMHDKLNFVLQTIEDKNAETSMQETSKKIIDEMNNSKYLVIDTIRESQIKLEEFVATIDNAEKIQDLKNIIENLFAEVHQTKDNVVATIRDNQDRFELIVKAIDNTDRVEEINDLSRTIYSEVISSKDAVLGTLRNNQAKIEEAIRLVDVNMKVDQLSDLSQTAIDEIKFTKEIIQNVGRSINPEVLNSLQSSIEELKNSINEVHNSVLAVDVKLNNVADKTDVSMIGDLVKERHEQLEYLIRAYDPTVELGSIKESLEGLVTSVDVDEVLRRIDSNKDVVYEVRSLLEEKAQNLELLMKSIESTDDINDLRDFLFNIEREQKETKASIDALIRNAENADDINYLKGLLLDVETEQKDLKNAIEELIRKSDDTSSVDGLHCVLSGIANEQKDLRGSIENIIPYDEFSDIKFKVESNKEAIYELRSALDERSQNLELLIKSLESSDDISDIKDIIFGLESEQKGLRDSVDSLAQNNAVTDRIEDLRGILLNIESVQRSGQDIPELHEVKDVLYGIGSEQKDLKGAVESLLRNAENADDINYLKGLLLDIEQEQKDFRSSLDEIIRNTQNTGNYDELRSELHNVLGTFESQQSEIKNALDQVYNRVESSGNTDDINYLKGLLLDIEQEQKDFRSALDEIIRNTQNTGNYDELRSELHNVLGTFESQQSEIKNALDQVYGRIETSVNADDINYLKGLLVEIEQEQRDYRSAIDEIARNTQNIGSYDELRSELKDSLDGIAQDQRELRMGLNGIVPYESLADIKHKVDDNKDMLSDLRSVLEERTHHLELVMKSVENTDDINELRDVLSGIEQEQLELKNIVYQALQSSKNSDEIAYLKDVLSDIENDQKEVKLILDNYLVSQGDDIRNYLGAIDNKVDAIEDIRNDVSGFSREVENLKIGLDGVVRKSDVAGAFEYLDDIKNDLSGFTHDIAHLKQELETLSSNKDVEEAVEHLENIQYAIKESVSENSSINEAVQAIKEKVNEIKNATDLNFDFRTTLGVIQEDQITLKALVSSLDDEESFNIVKEQIRESEYAIRDCIEAAKAKDDLEQIKYQLNGVTQQIVVQVMEVFENISFEQETQEIKEFVDESHNNVKSVLSVLKTNIERLLDAPKPIYIEELRQEIEKIANNLDDIGPEMSEYVSTITSLRVSLEELSKTKDLVALIDQRVGAVSVDTEELLRASREFAAQLELLYTQSEAKDDFAKIRSILESVIEKQQEQIDSFRNDDLKGGMDNVNLSINYINENLKDFMSDYRIFQDNLMETVKNVEGMGATFVQADSINSEFKKGVNETFKALKKEFGTVLSTVELLYQDMNKVSAVTSQMVDTSARDKAEVLEDMKALRTVIENTEIDKLKDNFSTIIFSINGFLNNVDDKFAEISKDTQGAFGFAQENKEVSENIKNSIVHILEWTSTAARDFTRIQSSIEAFRDTFDESLSDIRQIDEIKNIVEDLDSAIASRVEEVFDRQIQSKFDSQLLPEFELLDKKLDKRLTQKLEPITEAREQDKEELRFIITNQLSSETASLRDLVDAVEKNIADRIQHGTERILSKDVDFSEVLDRINTEFVVVNEKIDDSLSKIDTELYQANIRLEEGLNGITQEVSGLNSTLEEGIEKVNRNVRNINFNEITNRLEEGFGTVNQKIDDTNLGQAIVKIDDEFSAMNKKLDVDFFELNKRVVDEFNTIEEKLDARSERLLQNIENSNEQLSEELNNFTARIEGKSDQAIRNVETIKDEISKEFGGVAEKLDDKTNHLLRNVDVKMHVQGEVLSAALNEVKEEMTKTLDSFDAKADSAIQDVASVKEEVSKEFNSVAEKIEDKTNHLLRNVDVKMNAQSEAISTALSDVKHDLSKTLGDFAAKTDSMVDSFDVIKNELNQELNEVADNLNAQTGVVVRNIQESRAEIKNFFDKIDNYSDELTGSLNEIRKDIGQDLSQTSDKIERQNNEMVEVIADVKVELLNDITGSIEHLSHKLDAQSASIRDLETTRELISQVADKSDSKSNDNTALVLRNIEQARDSLVSVFERISESNLDINDIAQIKLELKEELDEILDRVDVQTGLILKNLETSKQELDSISGQFDTRFDSLVKEIEGSQRNLTQIAQRVDANAENLANIAQKSQQNVEKLSEDVQNGTSSVIDSVDNVKNILSQNIKSISSDIYTSSNQLASGFEQSVDALKSEVAQIVDKISNIDFGSESFLEISNKIDGLDIVSKEIFGSVQTSKNDIVQAVGDSKAEVKSVLKGVSKDIVELVELVGSQSQKLDSLDFDKADLNNISSNIDGLKEELVNEIRSIDNGSEVVISEIKDVKNRIESIDFSEEAQALSSKLDSLREDFSAIDNGSEAVIKEVSSTKQKLSEIRNRIDEISFEQEAQLISVSIDGLKEELVKEIRSIDNGSVQILDSIAGIKKEVVSEIKSLDNGSSEVLGSITEAKNDLSVINGKLDAQTGLVIKNVEDSNAKLDKTLEQVTSKIELQSKAVTKNLDENKKVVTQAISDISGKLDTQTEIVFKNLGESKVELDEISNKLSETSASLAQNIEASKEELEQELVQIIDKIDNQSAALSKAQDKKLKAFEEKLTEQERKIQAIDDKLDILINKLNNAQALDLSEVVSALESRMGSLDENIKKIVSFVDEE